MHLQTSANRRGQKSDGLGSFVPLRKPVPVECAEITGTKLWEL